MRLYFKNQQPYFEKHLYFFEQIPVSLYSKDKLIEKSSEVIIQTASKLTDFAILPFHRYQIFPPHIMSSYTQWQAENRKMQVGDTIVQQVYLPPYKNLSQKIIFGVRISELIITSERIGFSYETLQGHAEKGISTFTLEQTKNDQVIFKIHTFSQPGNWLTRLVAPVFSIPYQTYCTRQALQHVKMQLENTGT